MSKSIRAAVLFAAVLLAGCGGGSSSGSTAGDGGAHSPTHPCDLLTPAQAGAVLQDGTLTAKSDSSIVPTCSWTPQSSSNGSIDLSMVSVIIQDPAVFQGVAKQAGHSAVPGLTITKVNGVGDEAYFETTGQSSGTTLLLFRKGNSCIQVSVHKETFSASQVQDAETTLAQQIVEHL